MEPDKAQLDNLLAAMAIVKAHVERGAQGGRR